MVFAPISIIFKAIFTSSNRFATSVSRDVPRFVINSRTCICRRKSPKMTSRNHLSGSASLNPLFRAFVSSCPIMVMLRFNAFSIGAVNWPAASSRSSVIIFKALRDPRRPCCAVLAMPRNLAPISSTAAPDSRASRPMRETSGTIRPSWPAMPE